MTEKSRIKICNIEKLYLIMIIILIIFVYYQKQSHACRVITLKIMKYEIRY